MSQTYWPFCPTVFCYAYCIEKKAQINGTVIPWTILFHRIPSAKMIKNRIPQSYMIPQYRTLKLKLPKYRMKKSPIPQYRKPPCPPLYRLPKLNMLFQFLLTNFSKSELFFCVYRKLILWPTIAKRPILLFLRIADLNVTQQIHDHAVWDQVL